MKSKGIYLKFVRMMHAAVFRRQHSLSEFLSQMRRIYLILISFKEQLVRWVFETKVVIHIG